MSPSERNVKWVQAPLIGTFKKWKSIFCNITLKKKKEKKILYSFSGPKTIVNDTTGHGIENKKKIHISILRVRIWSNICSVTLDSSR